MSTLVVSDRITPGSIRGLKTYKWDIGRPSAEGYDTVILDLYFGRPTAEGCYTTSRDDAHFYELGDEVGRSLRAGGTVIALLGPIMVTHRNLASTHPHVPEGKRGHKYATKLLGQLETSYDWLDQGFLQIAKIDTLFARPASGVVPTSLKDEMSAYLESVSEYWISIDGIEVHKLGRTGYSMYHNVAESRRWGCGLSHRSPVMVLARGRPSSSSASPASRRSTSSITLAVGPETPYRSAISLTRSSVVVSSSILKPPCF